jgi:hypothetical protein
MLFFTDADNMASNALDACKTWICILIVHIRKIPADIHAITK